MTQKALAIDLDGTLLVGESLSARNRDAVKAASEAGFRIIIATARWRQTAERIANEIGLDQEPVIACSGAQVYLPKEKRDLYDARLPADFVSRFYQICNDNRCIATATVGNYSLLKLDKQPAPEHLVDSLNWVETFSPELAELPRIATVQGTATIELVRAMHKAEFAHSVNIFDSIGPSGKTVITITARLADKGIALTEACKHLGVDLINVTAFGDAHNDIAMFKIAGNSVAMGQAGADIKSAAQLVTDANTEDGVARYIEKYLLV